MTRTDQAFIEAFNRSQRESVAAPRAPLPVDHRQATLHGPHATFGAARTTLSEAIAQRMHQAAAAAPRATPHSAMQVDAFRWPAISRVLSENHREDYFSLITDAITIGGAPVLAFAGVQAGAGATTTTLAIARSLAAEHGPIVVVDADLNDQQLSQRLGVQKARSLAEIASAGGSASDAVVHAARDQVSLVVAGRCSPKNLEKCRQYAATIAAQHAIVLIDGGSLSQQPSVLPAANLQATSIAGVAEIFQPAGVVLIRRQSDVGDTTTTTAAQRLVEMTGTRALGVVDNRAATA